MSMKWVNIYLLVLTYIVKVTVSEKNDSYIVNTDSGSIEGYLSYSTRDHTPYVSYIGIPYAKPPLKELRFKAPVPIEPWTDILNATRDAPSCPNSPFIPNTSEDCLYLNIFTPLSKNKKKEVVVFIHGGSFQQGNSSITYVSPDFWMNKDIIFASFNYRLGPLGFLSLNNEVVPGNAGLKDQSLALRWIKQNIQYFDGDSESILLLGMSAGADSASLHHISPLSRGSFSKLILMSGSSVNVWSVVTPSFAVEHATALAKLLGCPLSNPPNKDEIYQCLLNADADEITRLQDSTVTWAEKANLIAYGFMPVIEPDLEGAFLSKQPIEYVKSCDFAPVPTIIGTVDREGLVIYPTLLSVDKFEILQAYLGSNLIRFVPEELNMTTHSPHADEVDQMIRNFYFNGSKYIFFKRHNFLQLLGDTQFIIDIQKLTSTLVDCGMPVWNYQFTYDGPFNYYKRYWVNELKNVKGVCHADDLGYLMHPSLLWDLYQQYNRTSRPHIMIDQLTTLWANFAKFGNPTPIITDLLPVLWKPFTKDEHFYLEIGEDLLLKKGLASRNMKLWNDVYELINGTRPLPE